MSMNYLLRVTCVGALVLAFANVGDASTISLKRGAVDPDFYPGGYAGAADNTIFYYSIGSGAVSPAVWMRSSDGAYSLPGLSNSGSGSRRNLLRFDLGGMNGQNVVVTSDATLTLYTYTDTAAGTIGLYQIAPENAGWTESTNNAAGNPSSAATKANNGDPTWWYKSIDTVNNTINAYSDDPSSSITGTPQDTTSVKWYSQMARQGGAGSNPEGWSSTGGLWNPWDIVDQNPATPVPLDGTYYLNMGNMDPVATAPWATNSSITFTIPAAMIQDWIDNPGDNAGFLVRTTSSSNQRFRSSESGASQRPVLTFDYEVIPEPATLSLLGFGLLGFLRRR